MQFVPVHWPSDGAIQKIVLKSGGYFIYASIIIKFIDEESFSPADRLGQVLNSSNSPTTPVNFSPFAELDKLYLQILSSGPTSNLPILKRILGYIVVPHLDGIAKDIVIDMDVIEAFLRLPRGQVKVILRRLSSLVSFGESLGDVGLPILHRASFGDFLLDKERSKYYHVDSEEWIYTTFCDAFSLGCRTLGFSVDASTESASRHPTKGKGLFVTLTCSQKKTDIYL